MSLTSSIPRFLLPQGGAIWRTRFLTPSTALISVRYASRKSRGNKIHDSNQPIVLEKPAKFNPPSHGSRRPKPAPRYPGPNLSAEEQEMQKTKKYPNMMPQPGTRMHWFIHHKSIHLWITLATLGTLAATVFITEFTNNSPFATMMPHWSQLFLHPIAYVRTIAEIIRLQSAKNTAETMERRKRKMDDVAKRAEFRKVHGLETESFGSWTAKGQKVSVGSTAPAAEFAEQGGEPAQERQKRPQVKKWLGIW